MNEIMNMDYAAVEARVMGSMFTGLKMTSREIAEVTGKKHNNVLRDIDLLISRGVITELNFELSTYRDSTGRNVKEYVLDFFATMTLTTGYDPKRRAAVIARWMELEEERQREKVQPVQPQFQIPQTFADALRLAADEHEGRLIAEQRADEAERTKMHISAGREATMFSKLGVLTKEINALKKEAGIDGDYRKVTAISWIKDYFDVRNQGMWVAVGKQLSGLAMEMEIPPKKLKSKDYPSINAYHIDVIDTFQGMVIENPAYLLKYRK